MPKMFKVSIKNHTFTTDANSQEEADRKIRQSRAVSNYITKSDKEIRNKYGR